MMIKSQRSGLRTLFVFSDVVAILFSFFYSYLFRFYAYIIPVTKGIPPIKSYIAVFPLFLFFHLGIFYLQGFYKTRLRRTKLDDFFYITLNAVVSIFFVFSILSYLYNYSQGPNPIYRMDFQVSHGFLALYFVVVVFMISFLRNQIYFFMKRRYAKGINLQNVLIVGAGEMGLAIAQKLSKYKDMGYHVKGFLDNTRKKGENIPVDGGMKVLGRIDQLESFLENEDITDVYVALDFNNYSLILETLKVVNKYTARIRLIPDLFQLLTLKARVEDLDGFPVISIDEPPLRGMMLFLKRITDIAASVGILTVVSPLLLLMAAMIKLTSKGPVFYHQERMGVDGKKFMMHKLRTMVCDAEARSGPVMCAPNDPRITKIGRFLRKFSIDEFPQLFNVLKGEMSLVGPRPERPVFVQEFMDKIPKYMLRHKVKSGVTGWAQVHGLRQGTPIEKRLEYDFYYIQNWSYALDLKILWKTLRKGFIDKSV
jgi:exopolysaccharide biosynthesis polyprenyl glycosylphosphotransferase